MTSTPFPVRFPVVLLFFFLLSSLQVHVHGGVAGSLACVPVEMFQNKRHTTLKQEALAAIPVCVCAFDPSTWWGGDARVPPDAERQPFVSGSPSSGRCVNEPRAGGVIKVK